MYFPSKRFVFPGDKRSAPGLPVRFFARKLLLIVVLTVIPSAILAVVPSAVLAAVLAIVLAVILIIVLIVVFLGIGIILRLIVGHDFTPPVKINKLHFYYLL